MGNIRLGVNSQLAQDCEMKMSAAVLYHTAVKQQHLTFTFLIGIIKSIWSENMS